MNFTGMTNSAVAKEIGQRIEQLRLEQNLTQQNIADAVGISRVSYGNLVSGGGTFVNMIGVLRELGQLSLLEKAVPETEFSPIEQFKLKGKKRQRARRKHSQDLSQNDSELNW